MDKVSWMIALGAMLAWGIGSFIAKLATNRIGEKAVVWDMLGYVPGIILYGILFFRNTGMMRADKGGVWLAVLAGFTGSLGAVMFYLLLARKNASMAVPMTAVYPAVTAILAIMFLGEEVTIAKVAGIIMSVGALVLLSL
jgi:bacterial/archaeal transporter family protein